VHWTGFRQQAAAYALAVTKQESERHLDAQLQNDRRNAILYRKTNPNPYPTFRSAHEMRFILSQVMQLNLLPYGMRWRKKRRGTYNRDIFYNAYMAYIGRNAGSLSKEERWMVYADAVLALLTVRNKIIHEEVAGGSLIGALHQLMRFLEQHCKFQPSASEKRRRYGPEHYEQARRVLADYVVGQLSHKRVQEALDPDNAILMPKIILAALRHRVDTAAMTARLKRAQFAKIALPDELIEKITAGCATAPPEPPSSWETDEMDTWFHYEDDNMQVEVVAAAVAAPPDSEAPMRTRASKRGGSASAHSADNSGAAGKKQRV